MERTVKDYMDVLQNIINNIPNQTEIIIKQNEVKILDLNRERQLFDKGIDSMGINLEPYSPATIFLKKMKGEVYNRTTLLDKGGVYEGFFWEFDKSKLMLELDSKDEKTPKLIKKYGENIFGLTIHNQNILNEEIIRPELEKYLKQWL